MAEAAKKCISCGSPLEDSGFRRAKCTNSSCPLGEMVYQCEFCETFSVTRKPEGLTCHNPKCRVYETLRKGCPTCDKVSLIGYKGMELCLNRRCSRNTSSLRTCTFCRREALLTLPDYSLCTKGHCDHFLVPLTRCYFCKAITYNIETHTCDNPSCRMSGVRMENCPSCNQRSRSAEPGQASQCMNPSCTGSDGSSAEIPQQTLMLSPDALSELDRLIAEPTAVPDPSDMMTYLQDGNDIGGDTPRNMFGEPMPDADSGADADAPAYDPFGDSTPNPAGDISVSSDDFAPSSTPSPIPFPSDSTQEANPFEAMDDLDVTLPMGADAESASDNVDFTHMEPGAVASPMGEVSSQQQGPLDVRVAYSGNSPLLKSLDFVRSYVLAEGDKTSPVYMVIGTAGAGKTTYLCMLGEILRARESKYYFPYKGIDVRRVQLERFAEMGGANISPEDMAVFRKHVKDLVFDFALDEYSGSIAKNHWPEQTPSDEASSKFLITELLRNQKPVAKIVTFETSGEDFEAALANITAYDPTSGTDNPLHKVLYELMDLAEGFVLLMPPAGRANDATYQNFFLAVREGIEPRGLNALSGKLKERLGSAKAEPGGDAGFTQMIQMARLDEMLQKQQTEEREQKLTDWQDALRQVRYRLHQGNLNAIDGPDGHCLKLAEHLILEMKTQSIINARNSLKEMGVTKERILAYYTGLVDFIDKHLTDLVPKLPKLHEHKDEACGEAGYSKEQFEKALWAIRSEVGISEDFTLDYTTDLKVDRAVRRFRNLRRIAVVFTKTDMYPAVYPPEQYPERNLPGCKLHIDLVEQYLKLLGGNISYYNASASGYSLLRDTIYVPGPENTLSPINVIEPVFDMLGIS